MRGRNRRTIVIGPSHPYTAGTEHVGFSTTRQTLLAPSEKRHEVFDESPPTERGGGTPVCEHLGSALYGTHRRNLGG